MKRRLRRRHDRPRYLRRHYARFAEPSDAGFRGLLRARDPTPRLVAPAIFEAEASNALLRAARQGRFEPERLEAAIRDLMMTVAIRIGGTASEVRALAWAEHISFFDACYLDLAMREGAPLASRDAALLAAAGRRGVAVEDLR